MLNKIMSIMNRKPKGNGLDGVPLKRQVSTGSFEENADQVGNDMYYGNEDIRLVQKNVDAMMGPENSRFSFEINPGKQVGANTSRSVNPFRPDEQRTSIQHSNKTMDTQPLPSPDIAEPSTEMVLAASTPFEAKEYSVDKPDESQSKVEISDRNPFKSTEKAIVNSNSTKNYQNDIQEAAMFDKNVPMTESEQKFSFHPVNQIGDNADQDDKDQLDAVPALEGGANEMDPDAMTFIGQYPQVKRAGVGGSKRLYPGQVTLNHVVRKNEVRRINRENMVSVFLDHFVTNLTRQKHLLTQSNLISYR